MLLGLLVHILFHKFKEKTIFSLVPRYYGLWLLQTLNPPTVTVITEVDCNYKLLKSDWLPVINYRLISHLLNPATHEKGVMSPAFHNVMVLEKSKRNSSDVLLCKPLKSTLSYFIL